MEVIFECNDKNARPTSSFQQTIIHTPSKLRVYCSIEFSTLFVQLSSLQFLLHLKPGKMFLSIFFRLIQWPFLGCESSVVLKKILLYLYECFNWLKVLTTPKVYFSHNVLLIKKIQTLKFYHSINNHQILLRSVSCKSVIVFLYNCARLLHMDSQQVKLVVWISVSAKSSFTLILTRPPNV